MENKNECKLGYFIRPQNCVGLQNLSETTLISEASNDFYTFDNSRYNDYHISRGIML